jgi:hypothetical protein
MRRNATIFATLSLATATLVAGSAGAAEPASPPAVAQPATPAPDGTKIGKSRSNIQNNRAAAPAANQPGAAAPESKGVVKTKTKSNQSND